MRDHDAEGIVGSTRVTDLEGPGGRTAGTDAETFHAGDRPIVQAIVEATAAASGRDPFELEPLYDAVDPDALSALVEGEPGEADVSVTLRYEGRTVTVQRGGEITVAAD